MKILVKPLTPDRWQDFERLFGPRGAYGGCWCMWWRLKRSEFERSQGEGNRQAMHELVNSGTIPGLLAFVEDQAIGWCSVARRREYGPLNRSRVLTPLDDVPVWSLVCLFVDKRYRGQRVTSHLIQGAIAYVASQGGAVLEAYPTHPQGKRLRPVSSFMGVPAIFAAQGFVEVARPSQSRVVMRYVILDSDAA